MNPDFITHTGKRGRNSKTGVLNFIFQSDHLNLDVYTIAILTNFERISTLLFEPNFYFSFEEAVCDVK